MPSGTFNESSMDQRPIFVVTHPRACSTAFERVFMTKRERLTCLHEPFGDAFYFGPERMSSRYEGDEEARVQSGFSGSTYQTILERFEREHEQGKRLFIKDMSYYLCPPDGKPRSLAPSLAHHIHPNGCIGTNITDLACNDTYGDSLRAERAAGEPENPTVIPECILRKFHFTFLIRHPQRSIPSFHRCTIQPLNEQTGWDDFMPSEAGYSQLRRLFDFLRSVNQVGPEITGRGYGPQQELSQKAKCFTTNYTANNDNTVDFPRVEICVIDADDLLDDPEGTIRQFCASVDLDYDPSMLVWETEEDHQQAAEAFEKWKGWHNDIIESNYLKPRTQKTPLKSPHQEYPDWKERYGSEAANMILENVERNIEDYEYLKQFALNLRN